MEREPKHRGEQDRGERPEKTDPEPGRAQVHADFVANAELSVIRLLLGRHAGNVRLKRAFLKVNGRRLRSAMD